MTQLNSIKHNVHEHCGERVNRVQGDIDREVFNYFFRHVICKQHGSAQALITFFFQKLYEACVEAGIPPVWDDEDLDGQRVVNIANRLNFDERT